MKLNNKVQSSFLVINIYKLILLIVIIAIISTGCSTTKQSAKKDDSSADTTQQGTSGTGNNAQVKPNYNHKQLESEFHKGIEATNINYENLIKKIDDLITFENKSELHLLKAKIYKMLNKAVAEEAEIKKAINLNRKSVHARTAYVEFLILELQTDEALSQIKILDGDGAKKDIVNVLKAKVYFSKMNYQKSIDLSQKALAYNAKSIDAYSLLAKNYIESGKFSMAKLALARALKIEEKNSQIITLMGFLELKQGNTTIAEKKFSEASKADPKNITALRNEAKLSLKFGDYNKSHKLYSRLEKLLPGDPIIYLHLGASARGKGDYEEAKKQYENGLQIDPDFADLYYNLGVLYHRFLDNPKLGAEKYRTYIDKCKSEPKNNHPVYANIQEAESLYQMLEAQKQMEEQMKKEQAKMKKEEEAKKKLQANKKESLNKKESEDKKKQEESKKSTIKVEKQKK